MLHWSQQNSFHVMLPFLALSGLCFCRTAELVRLYKNESVLEWKDILWTRRKVHIRAEVSKVGTERFPPFGDSFDEVMVGHHHPNHVGFTIPILHGEFSKIWKRMHAELGFKPIPNGMRRS